MATILTLAELASAVYGDTAAPTGWKPLSIPCVEGPGDDALYLACLAKDPSRGCGGGARVFHGSLCSGRGSEHGDHAPSGTDERLKGDR